MLSCDHGSSTRRGSAGRAVVLMIAAAITLSACVVQPVYAPGGGQGSKAGTTLRQIAIEPVEDRVAQVVRNKLIFAFTGGQSPGPAVYSMHLTTTVAEVGLGITKTEVSPSYAIIVSVTYQVAKIGSNNPVVLQGTVRGTASYDRNNQVFANTRARLDAENRAATAAADQIQIRVASATARGI